jgi:hypothetical protein
MLGPDRRSSKNKYHTDLKVFHHDSKDRKGKKGGTHRRGKKARYTRRR